MLKRQLGTTNTAQSWRYRRTGAGICCGYRNEAGFRRLRGSGEPDRAGFRPFSAFDYVNGDALPRAEALDARALKHGGMHKDILAPIVPNDEPKPFGYAVPLDGADFLNARHASRRNNTGQR